MPCSCEPICVASLMRWLSPPLRVLEGRLTERYDNPTSNKNCKRSRISFNTSFAMAFCLLLKRNSTPSNHAAKLSKFIADNSAIFLLSILNQRLSFLNLVPLQVAQSANCIYFSTQALSDSLLLGEENHRFSIGIIPS